MATQITNYQCPACTGPLRFSSDSGKLECEHCDSAYTVEEIETLFAEKETKAEKEFVKAKESAQKVESGFSSPTDDWGKDADGMKAYNCPSCGAELICDATTAATSCPYCGNPSIIPGQFGGILKPDYIIPFKHDKNAAVATLSKYYKGKKFLPKTFASGNHIGEIRGVYVPFWLFDGVCDADIFFEAKKSRKQRVGEEEITTTDHYRVRRTGTVSFEKIPVDASTKMPDAHMDAIEPFHYDEMKPFSTAYLAGYLADKYDVSIEESSERVGERVKGSARDTMRADVKGYESCTITDENIVIKQGEVKYALLPVWMLNTKWSGKDYLFAMNGQTGRLVGDLPVSKGKFSAWFFGIAVPIAAILTVFMLQ